MLTAVLVCKEIVVVELKNVVKCFDLTRVKVALSDLQLSKSTPDDVATLELKLSRQILLSEFSQLAYGTDIESKPGFIVFIHGKTLLN